MLPLHQLKIFLYQPIVSSAFEQDHWDPMKIYCVYYTTIFLRPNNFLYNIIVISTNRQFYVKISIHVVDFHMVNTINWFLFTIKYCKLNKISMLVVYDT